MEIGQWMDSRWTVVCRYDDLHARRHIVKGSSVRVSLRYISEEQVLVLALCMLSNVEANSSFEDALINGVQYGIECCYCAYDMSRVCPIKPSVFAFPTFVVQEFFNPWSRRVCHAGTG